MLRTIIKIDEEKCSGCGLCADACHEGAIGMVNGKAKLLRDETCDGLGNCLPVCPTGAITFEKREASEYNEEAVREHKAASQVSPAPKTASGTRTEPVPQIPFTGCPGTRMKTMQRHTAPEVPEAAAPAAESELMQWPVQIKLVPVNAPYFEQANLLVAADCTAYAYANFHRKFLKNRIALIGCPKLDEGDYSEKLTEILRRNNIKSVTIVRMEVPCCGGLENAVKTALQNCGKLIPWQVHFISTDGRILEE